MLACEATFKRLDVLIKLLNVIADGDNRERAVDAKSILVMFDVMLAFCLVVFTALLREMRKASDIFQRVSNDISAACDVVNFLQESLERKGSDSECRAFVTSAAELANKIMQSGMRNFQTS